MIPAELVLAGLMANYFETHTEARKQLSEWICESTNCQQPRGHEDTRIEETLTSLRSGLEAYAMIRPLLPM